MSGALSPLEEDLLAALDPGEIGAYAAGLRAALAPPADAPGERDRTAAFIRAKLRAWGVPATVHRFDALVSVPGEARLTLARRDAPVPAIGLPYSPATPPGGIVAELRATAPETAAEDGLAGAVALVAGPPTPAAVARIAAQGALAQVYIAPDEILEPTPVPDPWGGAAPTPTIAIGRAAGEGFLALCAAGKTPVRLSVDAGWATRRLLLPVATIKGVEEPEDFFLVGAPAPTAGDGGEAAACLLELCRVLAESAGRLRRGVRFAWWPQGAAAATGPVWYSDHAWADLGRHAACYVELAPLAGQGAGSLPGWAEVGLRPFADAALREGGVRALSWADAPEGASAAPFARLGLPALGLAAAGAGGIGACVPLLARLCTSPLIPFDTIGTARALDVRVRALLDAAGDAPDLAPLRARAHDFVGATERLQIGLLHIAQADSPNYEEGLELGGRILRRLHRLLLPALRHPGDPHAAHPATAPDGALLPGLATALATAGGGTDAGEATRRRDATVRERNRVVGALDAAIEAIDEALAGLRPLGFG